VHPRNRTLAIAALVAYGLLAMTHLLSHAFPAGGGQFTLTRVTQWLLMPVLAMVLWAASGPRRSRLVRLVLVALLFSWLGDTLPAWVADGDASFLTMVGGFTLAQAVYIAAFLPYRGRSFVRTNQVALMSYVAALAVLIYICAPSAGGLLVPVLVYGVLLTAMAVLASGLGRIGALGGALFFVSDALIAIRAFAPTSALPTSGLLVMTTYIAAQALLVAAVLQQKAAVLQQKQVRV